MSEKQFSLEYYDNMFYVKDNSNDDEYYLYWAVELLNELCEENKQLRKELDCFHPVMFQDMRKGTVVLYLKELK